MFSNGMISTTVLPATSSLSARADISPALPQLLPSTTMLGSACVSTNASVLRLNCRHGGRSPALLAASSTKALHPLCVAISPWIPLASAACEIGSRYWLAKESPHRIADRLPPASSLPKLQKVSMAILVEFTSLKHSSRGVLVLLASSAGNRYSGRLSGKPRFRKPSDTKPANTANEIPEPVSSLRDVHKSRRILTGCST